MFNTTMTKTFKMVMLPTEKAKIHLSSKEILIESISFTGYSDLYKSIPQHLYIISDEELKIGDVPYIRNGMMQFEHISTRIKKEKEIEVLESLDAKKIIATTDKTLDLPLIPDSFLPTYINRYNEGNQIKEVDLEMEEFTGFCDDGIPMTSSGDIYKGQQKLRKDNTIIIHLPEESKASEILNRILDEEFKDIPLSSRTDFMLKRDCPTRTAVLKAMLQFKLEK